MELKEYLYDHKYDFKGFNDIDVSKLLSIRIYQKNRNINQILIIKRIAFTIFAGLLDYYDIKINEKGSQCLIFKDLNLRSSFNELLENISSLNGGMDILMRVRTPIRFKVDLSYYTNLINWMLHLKSIKISFVMKVFIILDLTDAYKLQRLIKKNLNFSKYKVFTVLFDALSRDNLLVQIAKNEGLQTATLQHGHFNYPDKNTKTPNSPFGGFTSDYMLVWSPYTKIEALRAGIDESKIIVAGIPYYIKHEKIIAQKKNYFCLFLDADIRYIDNIKMIEIGKEIFKKFNITMLVKFHPSTNPDKYNMALDETEKEIKVINNRSNYQILNEAMFIISSSSSMLIEAAFFNTPVFRYKSNYDDVYKGINFLNFQNVVEALDLIRGYLDNEEFISDNVNYLNKLFSCDGDLEENYSDFYKSILRNDNIKTTSESKINT